MSSDTFSICSKCLGNDKHIKMIKQVDGEECRQCTRPFTIYRWGNRTASTSLQKTIICLTCARARNCCQSCLLDINYGIPTDLRDTALKMAGLEPLSQAPNPTNREVKAIIADKLEKKFKTEDTNRTKEILSKLAEKLNMTSTTTENAPIDVGKLAKKLPFSNSLDSTKYSTMTSFFIFGFPSDLPRTMISKLASEYGKLKSSDIDYESRCGYITFEDKQSANSFAESINENGLNTNKTTAGLVIIENNPMRVCFGKQRPLPRTTNDKKKLNGVVTKVMKQLTEKDKKSSSQGTPPTQYKALQDDYEE
ncbi:SLT11 Pre-mRNA-splicing factor SLT11 [Candida maltosa Xu316]